MQVTEPTSRAKNKGQKKVKIVFKNHVHFEQPGTQKEVLKVDTDMFTQDN